MAIPLASSAALEDQELSVLGIALDGEVVLLFPRGMAYYKIKAISDKYPGCEIVKQKVIVHYEILSDNEPYDTSALVRLY